MAASSEQGKESRGEPGFDPPLYKQRYEEVIKIARRIEAKKVVDMGCAECKLLKKLKKESYIEELFGVDIDDVLLQMSEHIIRPLTTDYLMPRSNPLQITLMQGSIAEPDARLRNADLLSCVEVIEHLDEDITQQVPQSIFGALQPNTVVVTTPNSEYNVLFPSLSGFRHHDHRFEWTRAEFSEWCSSIVSAYPAYSVEVGGVGNPPVGREGVGFCSQMAIFTRDSNHTVCEVAMGTPYVIIASATHPSAPPLSPKQRLCHEAEYYLNLMLYRKRKQLTEEDSSDHSEGISDQILLKLKDLLKFPKISSLCSTEEEISSALQLSTVVVLNEAGDCAVYPLSEGEDSSPSNSDSDS